MRRRLGLGIFALLAMASLTGCYPAAAGNHAAGTHHTVKMVVFLQVDFRGVAGGQVKVIADVTIVDGEHGINRGTGTAYPATWRGLAPQHADIDYWSGSNPTTFTVRGEMLARWVRSMSLSYKSTIRLGCYIERDGHRIPDAEMDGRLDEYLRVSDVYGSRKDHTMMADCIWVDRSKA